MGISHEQHAPDKRLDGIVQRVLTTRLDDGTAEIQIPPSGAIYLNYRTFGPIRVRFADGSEHEAAPLYCGGQLVSEMPVAVLQAPVGVVGLEFSPTGFYRLFGVDCSRLTDRMLDLAEIDQAFAAALLQRLEAAPACRRAVIMQQAMIERLPTKPGPSIAGRAAARIRETRGRIAISELSGEFGITPRHLRRLFARKVGVSPKQFAKIVQFNCVAAVLQSGDTGAMHDVALEHGYFDQAHFVRDFTRHVGQNPTDFMASGNHFLDVYLGRKAHF